MLFLTCIFGGQLGEGWEREFLCCSFSTPADGTEAAADSKRCAGTAAHRLGAGVGAGAGCWVLGAGCWVLGAGAGTSAGAWFGSFLEPGVLIWGPLWVSVSGLK